MPSALGGASVHEFGVIESASELKFEPQYELHARPEVIVRAISPNSRMPDRPCRSRQRARPPPAQRMRNGLRGAEIPAADRDRRGHQMASPDITNTSVHTPSTSRTRSPTTYERITAPSSQSAEIAGSETLIVSLLR